MKDNFLEHTGEGLFTMGFIGIGGHPVLGGTAIVLQIIHFIWKWYIESKQQKNNENDNKDEQPK